MRLWRGRQASSLGAHARSRAGSERPAPRRAEFAWRLLASWRADRLGSARRELRQDVSNPSTASLASFAHASRNAGTGLGRSTSAVLTTGAGIRAAAAPRAPSAPAVTDSGAPVVRSAPSGKEEGRAPSVSREESRPSESGRQDLNLRPLVPNHQCDPTLSPPERSRIHLTHSHHVVSRNVSCRLTLSRTVFRDRTPSAPRTPNAPRRSRPTCRGRRAGDEALSLPAAGRRTRAGLASDQGFSAAAGASSPLELHCISWRRRRWFTCGSTRR